MAAARTADPFEEMIALGLGNAIPVVVDDDVRARSIDPDADRDRALGRGPGDRVRHEVHDGAAQLAFVAERHGRLPCIEPDVDPLVAPERLEFLDDVAR